MGVLVSVYTMIPVPHLKDSYNTISQQRRHHRQSFPFLPPHVFPLFTSCYHTFHITQLPKPQAVHSR